MSAGNVPQPLLSPNTIGRERASGSRIIVLPNQYLHVAGVPLVLLGLCLSGFLLVSIGITGLPCLCVAHPYSR